MRRREGDGVRLTPALRFRHAPQINLVRINEVDFEYVEFRAVEMSPAARDPGGLRRAGQGRDGGLGQLRRRGEAVRVDHGYSRELDGAWVQELVDNFDERLLGTVVVNRRDADSLYIVDGQHRVEAARRLGFTHLWVLIVARGVRTEPELYLLLNGEGHAASRLRRLQRSHHFRTTAKQRRGQL